MIRFRLAALVVIALGCNQVSTRPEPPDVLLVTIDTLRADHVGAYGSTDATTPTLDRLAAEGVRFEHAIAATPLTLPSHATLFTGQQPPRHGVRHNGVYSLPDEARTLAERMRASGRTTGAVVSAIVLRRDTGIGQGFDDYDDASGSRQSGSGGYLERPADQVSDRAIEWLGRQRGPVFLWVHYYDPHSEYRPPERYAESHPGRPYDGEIAFVDAQLARIVEAFEGRAGARPAPLIAVTSDHGESLGEHGEATHSYTLYDATLRVPWILHGDDVPAGRVVDGVVSGVDLAPTLLGWLGLEPLPAAEGRDLSRAVRSGSTLDEVPAYSETLATRIDHGWSPLFSLRTRRHRYVAAPRPELYELASDPDERMNRYGELDAGSLPAVLAELRGDDEGSAPRAIGEDTRAQLEALGYAIPETPQADLGIDPKDGLPAKDWVDLAIEHFDAGEFDEAIEWLEKARVRLPASARVRFHLGYSHLRAGRFVEAIPHLEACTLLSSRTPQCWALLGDAQRQAGRPLPASAAYRRALELDPKEPYARVGLAWLWARKGDVAMAERQEQIARSAARGDAWIELQLAMVWDETGHPERARRGYAAVLETDPGHALANMMLALHLRRLGDVEGALRHRQAAGTLADDPEMQLEWEKAVPLPASASAAPTAARSID